MLENDSSGGLENPKIEKPRMLLLGVGPKMPFPDSAYVAKFKVLNTVLDGDIVTPVVRSCLKTRSVSGFNYWPFLYRRNRLIRNLIYPFQILWYSLRAIRKNGTPDVVISPNPLLTGILGVFIGRILRKPVIIEVNGCFEAAFRYGHDRELSGISIREMLVSRIIPFVVRRADRIKMLYEGQLDYFGVKRAELSKSSIFHDYVAIHKFQDIEVQDDKYILLLGYPWYLKGVDVLIAAFKKIRHEFPDHRLKVFGWCPEGREFFEELAGGDDRIELSNAVGFDKIPGLVSKCSVFVLASRTESMGRVLIEAMVCKKPVVASDVGGIPNVVENEVTGLLFKSGDANALADCLRRVLSDNRFAAKLGNSGFERANTVFSEKAYSQKYASMVRKTQREFQQRGRE